MIYVHALRSDVAIWLAGATLCCLLCLYCRMGLTQLIVLMMHGLAGLADDVGNNETSDTITINTPTKIKGAACLRGVTPSLVVNPTFQRNLVTSSSRFKQSKKRKHCSCSSWQTNTKHRLSETSGASQINSIASRMSGESQITSTANRMSRALQITSTANRMSGASQITSTASRTAAKTSYSVNMYDFRALCVGFVVHKVRVGQEFLQVLQLLLPGSFNQYSLSIVTQVPPIWGDRGSTVVKMLCHKSEGRCFDPSWCHWNFSLTKSFRSHYGSGVDSASNRNGYQEYFVEVKAAGA